MAQKQNQLGVTLLEAMVTLSLLAILLALGVPGMAAFIQDARRDSLISDLLISLNHARNAAIMRGEVITACPEDGQGKCANTACWQQGWIVFADRNGSGELDVDDILIHRRDAAGSDVTLCGRPFRRKVVYQSNGYSLGSTNTIRICDARGIAKARSVVISNTGRARVENGANICP